MGPILRVTPPAWNPWKKVSLQHYKKFKSSAYSVNYRQRTKALTRFCMETSQELMRSLCGSLYFAFGFLSAKSCKVVKNNCSLFSSCFEVLYYSCHFWANVLVLHRTIIIFRAVNFPSQHHSLYSKGSGLHLQNLFKTYSCRLPFDGIKLWFENTFYFRDKIIMIEELSCWERSNAQFPRRGHAYRLWKIQLMDYRIICTANDNFYILVHCIGRGLVICIHLN